MIDAERLAKLEALLARVRSRRRELGTESPGSLPFTVAAHTEVALPPAIPSPPADPAPFRPLSEPPPASWESPLPPRAPTPPRPAAPPPPPSAPSLRPKHTSRPEVPLGLFAMRPLEPLGSLTSFEPLGSLEPLPARPSPPGDRSTRNDDWPAPPEPPPMEVIELEVDPDPSVFPPAAAPPPSAPRLTPAPVPPLVDDTLEVTRVTGRPSLSTPLPAAPPPAAGAPPPAPFAPEPLAPAPKEPLESRSRLVAAPAFLPDEPPESLPEGESDDVPGYVPSDPTIEVVAAEVSHGELEALEDGGEGEVGDEDSAPSSSRRPISIDAKMSEADDVIPLHPPPPESGPLPAASPTIDLSLEPATSLPLTPERAEPTATVVRAEPAVTVVRAESARTDVAVFVALESELGAKTFGELLDEALSL